MSANALHEAKHRRVVCGTDFSDGAAQAATVAAMLAERMGETLVLIHVWESGLLGSGAAREPEERAALGSQLEAEAGRLRELGATVKAELLTGSPGGMLVDAGSYRRTGLVVVSSVGRSLPRRFLLGSVAERVAEYSDAPTLVVRDAAPFRAWLSGQRALRILIGHDLSPASDVVLAWTKQFQELGPCELIVAHVGWPPSDVKRLGRGVRAPLTGTPPELREMLEGELREKIGAVPGLENVQCRVAEGWGRPDSTLLDLAREVSADVVAVGSHQRRGLDRMRLGSVSRAVLRHAGNVVVVPAGEEPAGEGNGARAA